MHGTVGSSKLLSLQSYGSMHDMNDIMTSYQISIHRSALLRLLPPTPCRHIISPAAPCYGLAAESGADHSDDSACPVLSTPSHA
jgi:hypothetical protein